jgi:hypothetical protein
VRIFVMGVDQWRDEEAWPLPDTTYTAYHLDSDGRANTAGGDGLLTATSATHDMAATSNVFRPGHRIRLESKKCSSRSTGCTTARTTPGYEHQESVLECRLERLSDPWRSRDFCCGPFAPMRWGLYRNSCDQAVDMRSARSKRFRIPSLLPGSEASICVPTTQT